MGFGNNSNIAKVLMSKRAAQDEEDNNQPKAKKAKSDPSLEFHKKAASIKIRPAAAVRADERKAADKKKNNKPSKLSMPGEHKPVQGPKIKKTNPFPDTKQDQADDSAWAWNEMAQNQALFKAGKITQRQRNKLDDIAEARLDARKAEREDLDKHLYRTNKEYARIRLHRGPHTIF